MGLRRGKHRTRLQRGIAGKPVVKPQARRVVEHFKEAEAGHQELSRMSQMRCVMQHESTLTKRLAHNLQLSEIEIGEGLLQIANAAVGQLRRSARTGRSKVAPID